MDDEHPGPAVANDSRAMRSAVAGARAGRGFRYQDAVAAYFSVTGLTESNSWLVVPEGEEDISLEAPADRVQVQVRSRRQQRREVSVAQLASWISELWERHGLDAQSPTRLGVVLDRDVPGVPATGLAAPLDAHHAADLVSALKQALPGQDVAAVLAHAHLLVLTDPIGSAVHALAEHRGVPPAVAELAVRQIQARLAGLADDRPARLPPAQPGALGAGDVARIVDDTIATVNVDALEEPVREGLCEYADLFTPIVDEAFYLGVDVVAGHVVSGLVLDRPSDVSTVVDVLERRRSALIVGPSGSGKTSLAWLAAHATRHSVRWLRVTTTSRGAVPKLLRHVRTLLPTARTPVGLIVDHVGHAREELWAGLTEGVRHIPGVWILGTIREEDLGLVRVPEASTVVRPRLVEPLAQRLWEELAERGQVQTPGWREAFEAADGLMLEYLHLLTTGTRLDDTISGQVQRRRNEGRDLELRVLRITSLAAIHGARTDVRELQSRLAVTDEDMQRALDRLLEEHLLRRVGEAVVGGLHWLRSQSISAAAHAVPPPVVAETAEQVLLTVGVVDLAAATANLLDEGVLDESTAGKVLQQRLSAQPHQPVLRACLDGLREYGMARQARRWLEMMDAAGVAPAHRDATARMAVARIDAMDFLDPSVRRALKDLQQEEALDPRPGWLASLPRALFEEVAKGVAPQEAVHLLRAFHLLGDHAPSDVLAQLAQVGPSADLQSLSALIQAAADVDLDLADRFVDAAGGRDHLLERANRELAWVTDVTYAGEGAPEVSFRWWYIDSVAQPDVNEAVVAICRILAGLFPRAALLSGQAVDASGQLASAGAFPLADKRIPRENLPGEVDVHWNQTVLRRFGRVAEGESKTARLTREAAIVEASAKLAWALAERYVRGQRPTAREVESVQKLAGECVEVGGAQLALDGSSGDGSATAQVGAAADACADLWRNAFPRLFQTPDLSLAAFFGGTIATKLKRLDETYWRLLDDHPAPHVKELQQVTEHLRACLCELAQSDGRPPSSRMRRAARRSGRAAVVAVAQVAREQADIRLMDQIQKVEGRLKASGWNCSVVRRPSTKPGVTCWPDDEIAVVIDVPSLYDWLEVCEDIVAVVSEGFEPIRTAVAIPRRDGRLVPSFGYSCHLYNGGLVPAFDAGEGWTGIAGDQVSMPTHDRLNELVNAAVVVSAMDRPEAGFRSLVQAEREVAERASRDLRAAWDDLLAAAQEDDTGLLVEILETLRNVLSNEDLADQFARAGHGEAPEYVTTVGILRTAAAEWDIDPTTAAPLTAAFLNSP